MSRKVRLDGLDFRILEVLQKNATIKNNQLSKEIGLSPPATLHRVDLLKQKGYLLNAHFELDWDKLNFEFKILIVSNVLEINQKIFYKAIKECPNILFSYTIKSEVDLGLDTGKIRCFSVGIFRDEKEFIEVWSLIEGQINFHVNYHVWSLGETIRSERSIPIS